MQEKDIFSNVFQNMQFVTIIIINNTMTRLQLLQLLKTIYCCAALLPQCVVEVGALDC